MTVRQACRQGKPLDGTDAQALEHALTITERERDEWKRRAEIALHDLEETERRIKLLADRQSKCTGTFVHDPFTFCPVHDV